MADDALAADSSPSIGHVLNELRSEAVSATATSTSPPASGMTGTTTTIDPRCTLLYFDGGSRGSTGPGGAGAVIVSVDPTGAHPTIEWCASFAYSDPQTTNNYAEYQGVGKRLEEMHRRGWKDIHVIGDSQLILSQLRHYHPPQQPRLRSLYAKARRLADKVGIETFHHHLRAFNKMADAAANVAMDHGTHACKGHLLALSPFAALHDHLIGDVARWSERWVRSTPR